MEPVNKKSPPAKNMSSIEALAGIIAGMSRFLTRVAAATPFREANIGLAEWSALVAIASAPGMGNKQLANVLGVSGQRATQITDSLKSAGLITVAPAQEDSRKVVITVTEAGERELKALNDKLKPLIAAKSEKLLPTANRMINRRLMRLPVLQPTPADKEARAARAAQSKQRRNAAVA